MSGRPTARLVRLTRTAVCAAQLALLPLAAPAAAVPQPGDERSTAELLTDLQRLFREAERATETYNATEEELRKRRAEADRLDAALARARVGLHDSRTAVGRLARQQYQGGDAFSPYVRLLLARDPQQALDEGHVIGRVARERAAKLARLTDSERHSRDLARAARKALDDQLTLAAQRKKQRDDVRARLHDVEELLASLSPDQLAALAELERTKADEAQRKLSASGALPADDAKPSDRGERALRFARQQLGKPYEWGAEGPAAYDCSGLTARAWEAAGTPIPRTSEEQWARLPHVPLSELRPGDLVLYFPEATHVGIYAGGGTVIEAPREGERIRRSPIATYPILGAVRPDADRGPTTAARDDTPTARDESTTAPDDPAAPQGDDAPAEADR
ncbi:NlpC/P60 family protein [Streptomyces sp. NPDC057386]|uniref:C40 family peptidase n=1 Tax=unclassified Streptomyces TaxID=2593676 RepID=UPI00362CB4E2